MGNSLISNLIEALGCLPGVGPRSAQRMAFYLLQRDRKGAQRLAKELSGALEGVVHCNFCNTLSDEPVCKICASGKRDLSKICIVEMPIDVAVIEDTGTYRGVYFVLMGKLSPLDGIGPEDINFDRLQKRVEELKPAEIIIATSFTSEGEATAHFISQMFHDRGYAVNRPSRGLPIGVELEYADNITIAQAFKDRSPVE